MRASCRCTFDADETVLLHRLTYHRPHAAAVAPGVYEGKAVEPVTPAGDQAGDLAVGLGVVGVEGEREDHAAPDAGGGAAAQVVVRWRCGVPGAGKTVEAGA